MGKSYSGYAAQLVGTRDTCFNHNEIGENGRSLARMNFMGSRGY